MKLSRNGRAALAYVHRLRWPVFPCRGKLPLIAEADGGHGYLDATLDEDQIVAWWTKWPGATIGISCDERSGLAALDEDPRAGGDDELASLEREHGELPTTPTQLSGGGGRHFVFRRPVGVNFRAKIACGLDIKANGYIIGAPSVHPDTGREYAWEISAHPLEVPIVDPPAWLLQRMISYEVDGYGKPADDAARSFLARAFGHAGWLGERIDAVRINALCPWEDEHTQKSGSGGTIIFAPREGSGAGWFHCAHTSHGRKTLLDVLAVLPVEAVRAATADICDDAADAAYEAAERAAIAEEG